MNPADLPQLNDPLRHLLNHRVGCFTILPSCHLRLRIRSIVSQMYQKEDAWWQKRSDHARWSENIVSRRNDLLSLVIVSRFRDELDLDIQHESLFLECPTVADLEQFLVGGSVAGDVATALPELPVPAVAETFEKKVITEHPVLDPVALAVRRDAVTDLGEHLVYLLAQLPDVKTVVCLNRENRDEPYTRQLKAMRGKGIRFPEALKPKLVVLQSDSSKPLLGLAKSQYDSLVGSVTHLIHNAWPMSAKRALVGFEPQFQVVRNLIDFASAVSSDKTIVPKQSVDIDSVLTNGYGEAKWGCERMLDKTMQKHPKRFRAMVVRLGQIATSKTSGYTLNALPDVLGTVYWTPVNDIAGTLSDLLLADNTPYPVYHIENPVGQPWKETNTILADALGIKNLISFEEWVERVKVAPQRNNPTASLLDFLDSNYLRMSCGGLGLDVKHTLEHSKPLQAVGPVSEEVIRKYIHIWKEIRFLN
ncbi:Acyl transferase/acyl hydrolase/lysophospholipase [Penicillium maclennaniae]|uniref:Acyl transferase/acyl hydrolase/lysophospholipase n=1 Tax=Penicillium maclennaniae TaxID=1343394 RepID=UPI002541EC71|nr:Acyl transferase/acyl hydrolase/lysophospholipase [Penicillium maclennaniae]KAJ5681682.1 Acyl transferase/acyl hydrolase/lysophospholipase [Penicillium maclennaniae]